MKSLYKRLSHFCYLIVVAWMLGVSNVILEETRMVHDTRAVIEVQALLPDTDLDDDEVYQL
jgi:hypothetical protein